MRCMSPHHPFSGGFTGMSFDRPLILHVGSPATATSLQRLIAPYNGYVYEAFDLLEALAKYVSYSPDVVVLDAQWDSYLAERTYIHLESVEAEPILILDSVPERWSSIKSRLVRVVADEPALFGVLFECLHLAETAPCPTPTLSYK